MPSVPALPPAAGLSFAERVGGEEAQGRPRTAPPRQTFEGSDASAREAIRAILSSDHTTRATSPLPCPPLPLVLRHPPLRKKKSFSRVSSWLFPGSAGAARDHKRSMRGECITNRPVPVTNQDDFYQCVMSPDTDGSEKAGAGGAVAGGWRASTSSSMYSTSSWEMADPRRRVLGDEDEDEDDDEERTAPTTVWSPASSPVLKQEAAVNGSQRRRSESVGVAL